MGPEQSCITPAAFLVSLVVGSVGARAFYALNSAERGKDSSGNRNRPARLVNVKATAGPDGLPMGSYYLGGVRNSYILFPNSGCLDTKDSLTIVAWIYPESAGPIFHYNPKGWGVHLWMVNSRTLLVKFKPRSLSNVNVVSSRQIKPRAWNYVAATYDHRTGLATLWREAVPIAQRNIGRLRLATNYPAIAGKLPGDRRAYHGRIACVQIFDRALNGKQLKKLRKKCLRGTPFDG